MAGVPGFEPGNGGIKTRCLTAWRYSNENLKSMLNPGFESGGERARDQNLLSSSLPLGDTPTNTLSSK